MIEEANTEVVEQEVADPIDSTMDKVFDDYEKENSQDSSSEIKPEGEETTTEDTSSAEDDKTEKVSEVEDDTSLSAEDKIAKISEILGDDEQAIDAYIKDKGYHNDPAWIKQREIISGLKEQLGKGTLSDEDKQALEDAKKITSSPEGIRLLMKGEGYSEEKINQTLKEKGFETEETPIDEVALITSKLGIDPNSIDATTKETISDVAKVVKVLLEDELGKRLPKELAPLRENAANVAREKSANVLVTEMKKTVSEEGILDYTKDIQPILNEWLDKNPQATQDDLKEQFRTVNHQLTIERLKTGGRKKERENLKGSNRPLGSGGTTRSLPKKTGDYNQDADALLDSLGLPQE